MPDKKTAVARDAAAMAAKQFVLASRVAMEAILRPYQLGGTQWWILDQLAARGEIPQRELASALNVERATASEVILTLVRKGLVEQVAQSHDQRQKTVRLTAAGRRLRASLPDPMERLYDIAFADCSTAELATVARVLGGAGQRLKAARREGDTS